jgi:hypothetical protein
MMQPTENLCRSDATTGGKHVPMDTGRNFVLGWFRSSRTQRRVRLAAIVMAYELAENPLQVRFA